MKIKQYSNFLAFALIVALTAVAVFAQTKKRGASASGTTASAAERRKIEKIVREYILANPSIIREANLALEQKEAKEKEARTAQNLRDRQKEIFADPLTPTAGNAKADVAVAVFFDYNCGYCRKSLPGLNDLLKKDQSVRVVYKEFPILGPQSLVAAKAALAANLQGKYLEFHNALFEADDTSDDAIKKIAQKLKLDYPKLLKDMESREVSDIIEKNYRLAGALDINGTPAYIVGETLLPGAIDGESLARIVKEQRSKK